MKKEEYMWRQMIGAAYTDPASLGFVLRTARREGVADWVWKMVKDVRRGRLDRWTVQQQEWRTSVSRRPQRGRHHDSWVTREAYARAEGPWHGPEYRERQAWCNQVLLRFPEWGVAEPFKYVRRLPKEVRDD